MGVLINVEKNLLDIELGDLGIFICFIKINIYFNVLYFWV